MQDGNRQVEIALPCANTAVRMASLSLVAFEHELNRVLPLYDGGLREFIVDHESRGKERRQLGADTEINEAPLAAIEPLARLKGVRVHCRINAWCEDSHDEIERAIGSGASRIYLPMARGRGEVEAFLRAVDSRTETAILIETKAAVDGAEQFGDLPLNAVFVGLNDLAISRGQKFIFTALRDGSIDRIRAAVPAIEFGFGGATCIDCGDPIPCRMLLGELAAHRGGFTFMRRSFRRDIVGRDIPSELARLQVAWLELLGRTDSKIERDRVELHALIRSLEPA